MIRAFLAACLLTAPAHAADFDTLFPGFPADDYPEMAALLRGMEYRQGTVTLPGGQAVLEVGPEFYFLDAEDATTVLTDLWGNPEDPATLGMLFPVTMLPTDSTSWGVELTWDATGYVSDADAEAIDYDALLAEMRRDTRAANAWRVENGYPAIDLVGWASAPAYDAANRQLHWAKELAFSGDASSTLNYNLRALGRYGVLQLNFIADIEALGAVEAALPEVKSMVRFTEGNRYADFDPTIDEVAAVGLGGLIAGKVLTKTGVLAVALMLLKKFWFVLLLPIAWLGRIFRRA